MEAAVGGRWLVRFVRVGWLVGNRAVEGYPFIRGVAPVGGKI